MRVSVNIMTDGICRYKYESHLPSSQTVYLRRVALLPQKADEADLREGCLYVGLLSEAMRVRSSGFICFCLRDRERDETETDEALAGLLIVDEDIALERFFTELQDVFVLVKDWYEEMQSAIITKKTIQDIIDMSEHVIGNFISVSDSALSLIAYTKNIPTDDPISLFLIENGYHSEETFKKFKKYRRFETWMTDEGLIVNTDRRIAKHTVVSKVFTFGESYFTHVVMSCTDREVTQGLLDLFACLAEVLGYYAEREWDEKKDYNYIYNSLIAELMSGKVAAASVRERARIVGISAEDKYVVMLPVEDMSDASAFPERIARDISNMFCNVRPVYFNMRLMFFLHHSNAGAIIEERLTRLDGYFCECNIRCGISDVFDDLLELPDAYRQAEIALSESGSQAPGRCGVARFDAYYAWRLFDKSEGAARLLETSRYGKMLAELHRVDSEKHSNNFEVLRIYLINERRAAETAAALHMHRNNVTYRIGRIEEMLNIDLEDWRTRKNLMASMLAMHVI